jgi:hypothetical protein
MLPALSFNVTAKKGRHNYIIIIQLNSYLLTFSFTNPNIDGKESTSANCGNKIKFRFQI